MRLQPNYLTLNVLIYCGSSNVSLTSTLAIGLLGDAFDGPRHELFLRMVVVSGDEFIARIKATRLMVEATPSLSKSQSAIFERTRRILEIHTIGLKLLTMNLVNICIVNSNVVKVDWSSVDVPLEQIKGDWKNILHVVFQKLRCVESFHLKLPMLKCSK